MQPKWPLLCLWNGGWTNSRANCVPVEWKYERYISAHTFLLWQQRRHASQLGGRARKVERHQAFVLGELRGVLRANNHAVEPGAVVFEHATNGACVCVCAGGCGVCVDDGAREEGSE